jgi:hypothetical protein
LHWTSPKYEDALVEHQCGNGRAFEFGSYSVCFAFSILERCSNEVAL